MGPPTRNRFRQCFLPHAAEMYPTLKHRQNLAQHHPGPGGSALNEGRSRLMKTGLLPATDAEGVFGNSPAPKFP
jgi:hypothetical protein